MKKVSNQEIADMVGKNVGTINGWNKNQPNLLKLVRTGAFCEKNNLDIDKIKKLVELQEVIQKSQ